MTGYPDLLHSIIEAVPSRVAPWAQERARESITGFIIFNAESLDEATMIARNCPIVSSNRIYEIMTK